MGGFFIGTVSWVPWSERSAGRADDGLQVAVLIQRLEWPAPDFVGRDYATRRLLGILDFNADDADHRMPDIFEGVWTEG